MRSVHMLATMVVATTMIPHGLTTWRVLKKAELRVYQGVDDVTNKYPYVVILQPRRFCTGSLITPEWVLTAAHCCLISLPSHIQYGKLSAPLNATESKSEVIRRVRHPGYRSEPLFANDVALLLVSPGVRMDRYGTVSAVDYTTLMGLSAEYVGAGSTFVMKLHTRNKVYKYKQDKLRPLQIGQGVVCSCETVIQRGRICVSPRCSIKQMVLGGDSGGPLLVDNKIVGITNMGYDDNPNSIFTPISPNQEWIHSVITAKRNSTI